jgi:hypothetical protein
MKMRKINKIWYVIWLAIGISFFISGCPFKSEVEGKAWFRYASQYDQAWSKIVASGGPFKDWGAHSKVLKIKQKFLRARQPTETEIISVLSSPNRRFQKVALVAMSLKPIETDRLTDILFEFLRDQEPEFKWYAFLSLEKFTKFPESRKADLGKQLLEIIKNEKEDVLPLPQRFTILAKFPSEEAALFLTEQLMKEGKERRILISRLMAFKALKKMGDSYYDEAKEYVNKHGSPDIKKELMEREKFYENIKDE